MKVLFALLCLSLLTFSAGAWAVTTYSYEFAQNFADYSIPISSDDVIQGMVGTIEAGGFHSGIPNDPAKFTDGLLGEGVDCVLQDYGKPALTVSYTFAPMQIAEIRSYVGNGGRDGRVFQNIDVSIMVGDSWFEILHEATTGPYGVANPGNEGSLIRIYEQGGGGISEGDPISGIKLTYWCADNTQNWFVPRDDAGAVCAPILKEIDVMAVPEPCSMLALAAGLGGLFLRKRSR